MSAKNAWNNAEAKSHVEKILAGAKATMPHPSHPKDSEMLLHLQPGKQCLIDNGFL